MIRKTGHMFILFVCFLVLGETLIIAEEIDAVDKKEESPLTVYSIDTLYKTALENSETIKISTQNLALANEDKSMAISALIPDLSAYGNYTRFNDATIAEPDSSTWGARFDFSFTLNGRELTVLGITKDGIQKSEYDLKAVKEEYLHQVATGCYAVAFVKLNLKLSRANMERLERHKDAVLTRLKLGDVTKTALFRAEAELSRAKTNLVRVENDLKLAKAALAKLIGLTGEYQLKDPNIEVDAEFKLNISDLKHFAVNNRAELKSGKLGEEMSKKMVKVSKGAYWPTIALEAEYRNIEISYPSMTNESDNYYGAVTMEFPIYTGGARRSEIRKAKANQRIAQLTIDDLTKKIYLEVDKAYLDLMSKKSELVSLNDQLKSSEQHYRATSLEFKHGLANTLDVMDSNNLLIESEKDYAFVKYSYKLAEITMKRVVGIFLDEVLRQSEQ